jgi:hypothetical protein
MTQIDDVPRSRLERRVLAARSGLQHTPGPFHFRAYSDGCDDILEVFSGTTDEYVASITFWDCDDARTERAIADLFLIVAAPDLLQALRTLVNAIGEVPSDLPLSVYQAEQEARQAIALAT